MRKSKIAATTAKMNSQSIDCWIEYATDPDTSLTLRIVRWQKKGEWKQRVEVANEMYFNQFGQVCVKPFDRYDRN